MDFFDALHASAAGLSAQRLRMNLISGNLANAHTTYGIIGVKVWIFKGEVLSDMDAPAA